MELGAGICQDTVDLVIEKDGDVPAQPQREDLPLHAAPKIFKETCEIDWTLPAKRVYDFVRGLSPYPGTWTTLSPRCEAEGKNAASVLKVFRTAKTNVATGGAAPGTLNAEHGRLLVATGDEWLEIVELQAAGKKRMAARDFLNGFKNVEEYRVN